MLASLSVENALAASSDLSVREALSGIAGCISLAAWVFFTFPQLIENYKNGHADGLSLAFLLCWAFGDICNLIGSVWAGLLPTVIALAVYFAFQDVVLILQLLYYKHASRHVRKARAAGDGPAHGGDPTQPLLQGRRRSSTTSHRRYSHTMRRDSLSALLRRKPSTQAVVVRNICAIVGVCAVGTFGWWAAWSTGAWAAPDGSVENGDMPMGASVLGYLSATLYLGARIPQIIKNYRTKSTDGLSLLMFMLSILGNVTFGAQILLHSMDGQYVVDNLPWLAGSLGTIVQDVIVFVQFHLYRQGKETTASAVTA